MNDIYKDVLDTIMNNVDNGTESKRDKATAIMDLIRCLLVVYCILLDIKGVLLQYEMRNIDNGILKARYN